MNTLHHKKLIILGSGPAGYTAAIYAARANLKPTLITGLEPGGQLTKNAVIENWPGTIPEITGTELMDKMRQQAQHFGAEVITDQITQVKLAERPFSLKSDITIYSCDALIIATGATAKYLGLPSEQKYLGRGISACAICDGFFYKNKKVAVIGGGNSAADEALYLANLAAEVTLIHRRNTLRADPILVTRLEKTPNIKFELNYTVTEFCGDATGITGINIQENTSKQNKVLEVAGAFIAIGHQPNTKIFAEQLTMEHGYIKVGYGATTATAIPGVFAAGDVTDYLYRQAVTAAGSGCMAALDVKNFFNSLTS